MKKLLLVLSFITGLSVMAQAQIMQKSPDQRAAHMTKALQKHLNLSADQASQVNVIFLTRATRMDSLKNNPSPDKKTDGLTRRSIAMTTHQQVMSVLNDDQRKQFMQWEEKRKEKHKEMKEQGTSPQG